MEMKTLIMMTYCFLCIAQLGKSNMRMMLAEQYKTQPLVSDWIDGSGQRETDLFPLGRLSQKNWIFWEFSQRWELGRGFCIPKTLFRLCGLIDMVREVCNKKKVTFRSLLLIRLFLVWSSSGIYTIDS